MNYIGSPVLDSFFSVPRFGIAIYYQVERKYQKLKMNTEITQTKICKKCGRILPVEEFNLVRGQFYNLYYRGECKECEYKRHRKYAEEKNKIKLSDHLEIYTQRHYKEIKPVSDTKHTVVNLSQSIDILSL